MGIDAWVENYAKFFRLVTSFEPYSWQVDVAQRIYEARDGGLVIVRAGTGSGKTEASTLPGLFLGRQVIVVEPFRALIEDMALRFAKILRRLLELTSAPYTLGVDYGGRHYMYECTSDACRERATKKPFGADVIVTTMDEMVYRVLSVATPRKASVYTSLIRLGKPVVFFDEAHTYSTEAANPLVTTVHLIASLAMYSPVVLASATLPEVFIEHLKLVAERNGLKTSEVTYMPTLIRKPKAYLRLDMEQSKKTERVERFTLHARNLISKGYKSVLVRVIEPEAAYIVYSKLRDVVGKGYSLGVLHGRMPVLDRERVFKRVKEGMENGERLVLVATGVIEAGVDLDFDAGVIELVPYRSLEQSLGRVNRGYQKDSEVVIVDTIDETWRLLESESYLGDFRRIFNAYLHQMEVTWDSIASVLKEIDEKYTGEKLSTPSLLDAYDSPYSKMLAVSLYSLFHLEGTFLEHLLALSKTEYETRGTLDIVVEVEGEPGNTVRVPASIAEKVREKHGIDIEDRGTIPRNLLMDHSYIVNPVNKIDAGGLVVF